MLLCIFQKGMCQVLTSTSKDDPWWNAFSSACEKLYVHVLPSSLSVSVYLAACLCVWLSTDFALLILSGNPFHNNKCLYSTLITRLVTSNHTEIRGTRSHNMSSWHLFVQNIYLYDTYIPETC